MKIKRTVCLLFSIILALTFSANAFAASDSMMDNDIQWTGSVKHDLECPSPTWDNGTGEYYIDDENHMLYVRVNIADSAITPESNAMALKVNIEAGTKRTSLFLASDNPGFESEDYAVDITFGDKSQSGKLIFTASINFKKQLDYNLFITCTYLDNSITVFENVSVPFAVPVIEKTTKPATEKATKQSNKTTKAPAKTTAKKTTEKSKADGAVKKEENTAYTADSKDENTQAGEVTQLQSNGERFLREMSTSSKAVMALAVILSVCALLIVGYALGKDKKAAAEKARADLEEEIKSKNESKEAKEEDK